MKYPILALVMLVTLSLACGGTVSRRQLELYPSATVEATQTPYIVVHTATPNATYTPLVVVVSATPNAPIMLCVSANEAVYLRPAPNADNYPIVPLPNDTRLQDLGGRKDGWVFVALGTRQGWVNGKYIKECQ